MAKSSFSSQAARSPANVSDVLVDVVVLGGGGGVVMTGSVSVAVAVAARVGRAVCVGAVVLLGAAFSGFFDVIDFCELWMICSFVKDLLVEAPWVK